MTSTRGRRAAVLAAAVLAVATAGLRADAATGNLAYGCTLPVLGKSTFLIDQDTNVSTVYLGRSARPVLTTRAQIPEDKVSLIASALKAKYTDGTITALLKSNGVETPVSQVIPKTALPASGPMTLVAQGALAALAPKAVGSMTYLPGDLRITLNFYETANGPKSAEFKNLPCAMPKNDKVVDKVAYAKSPSKVTPSATYAKSAKKVTAVARVTAVSGVVPTGKVTAVLYQGAKKLKAITADLAGGKATAVFAGIKTKGSYKVVITYAGSPTVNGSTGTKALSVR